MPKRRKKKRRRSFCSQRSSMYCKAYLMRLSSMFPRGVRPLLVMVSTPRPRPPPLASPSWSYCARYKSRRRVHEDVLSSPLLVGGVATSSWWWPCDGSRRSAAESGYAVSGVGARSRGGRGRSSVDDDAIFRSRRRASSLFPHPALLALMTRILFRASHTYH